MSRDHARTFLTACASGTVDLMDPTMVKRLETIVESLDGEDDPLACLASQSVERLLRVALESWADSLDLAVVEKDDPATEVQALRAIGRARAS